MRLKNTTDIPDETLREIIRFVSPNGVTKVSVTVRNGRSEYHGTGSRWEVLASIGNPRFPYQMPAHQAYLPILVRSREELAIALLAHELRHSWQARGGPRPPKYVEDDGFLKTYPQGGYGFSRTPFPGGVPTKGFRLLRRPGQAHARRRGMVWGAR